MSGFHPEGSGFESHLPLMAKNVIVNDVNTHIEWKSCTTGKYPCDPIVEKEEMWGRQFTSYPKPQHAVGDTISVTGEFSYEELKMRPSGLEAMPSGTVLRTHDGVTKYS